MKKVLSALAIMALVSGQAFAQSAPADAPAAPAAVAAPAAPAAPAATSTGLSTGALISIGVALAAVAAVASDNSTTTITHASTTHH